MSPITLTSFVFCIALAAAYNVDRQAIDGSNEAAQSRIVGGENASRGQFPHQASLCSLIKPNIPHVCGASILNERFLLTAAHCVQGELSDPRMVLVLVGAVEQDADGYLIRLAKIISHPGFDLDLSNNDVSLLKTNINIVFSDTVQPIALPTEDLPAESLVTVSGWGRTAFPYPDGLPNHLQFTHSKTISVEECREIFKPIYEDGRIHNSTLCTKNQYKIGLCLGDSGGPLIYEADADTKFLVGVAIFAVPCAEGFPDGYTRVYSHLDWIHFTIESA